MTDRRTLPEGTLLHSGTYRVLRFISSGGFGCTYEAVHISLEKRVAIKEFFPQDFCNRDSSSSHISLGIDTKGPLLAKLRAKFIAEAKAISRLPHPGIVSVTDVFEENGTAYYVMDYVDGLSLAGMVKKDGPMPEAKALGYIRQVCDALEYVHSHNRLHLDIKPGNIMVDAKGRAILIDFGASKQYDEESGENTSTLMGKTPGYAPIEQMSNTVSRFLPATDIYALGATLYKLLTGVTPMDAALRVSGEDMQPLPDTVSAPVRRAVGQAMAINRKERPQSIAEFRALLDAEEDEEEDSTIIDEPVIGKIIDEKPEPKPTPVFIRYKKYIAAAVIAILVCIGAAIFYSNYGGGEPDLTDSTSVPVKIADTVPVPDSIPSVIQEEKAFVPSGRTTYQNLDLATTYNGSNYYFSQSEWKALPDSEKSKYTKKGLVITGKGEEFILALHDSGKKMTWDEAMKKYGDRLPTKEQARVMPIIYYAINDAIRAFGGDKDPVWVYWTRTEYDSSNAYYVSMGGGAIGSHNKTDAYRVRPVVQTMATTSTKTDTGVKQFTPSGRTTYRNLDLATTYNGSNYYFSQSEWKALLDSEKSKYTKKGLVVVGNGEKFILALHDSGREMTWGEAMKQYGDRLPTKEQGEVMAKNYKAIIAAIKDFGGDKDPEYWYWTRTENNSSFAWFVAIAYGNVETIGKTYTGRVRAVASLPSSAI